MAVSSYDGNDTYVLGDDGSADGVKITSTVDGAKKRLDVSGTAILVPTASTFGTILYQNEIAVATKVETDMPSMSRTVGAGKTFVLTCFTASYDTQSPIYIRIKKQTAGAGAFVTQMRITLKQHGQDNSQVTIPIPYGVAIAGATDVIKVTYESALSKGTLWAAFMGIEY